MESRALRSSTSILYLVQTPGSRSTYDSYFSGASCRARGRLQGVADSFHPKLARCDAAELRVDEWQQLIKRSAVAATPISEERRDVVWRGHQLS